MPNHYCNFCNSEIRWATTPRGARIPLEASPDPKGRYLLTFTGGPRQKDKRAIATYVDEPEATKLHHEGELLWARHNTDKCSGPRPPVPPAIRARLQARKKKP